MLRTDPHGARAQSALGLTAVDGNGDGNASRRQQPNAITASRDHQDAARMTLKLIELIKMRQQPCPRSARRSCN